MSQLEMTTAPSEPPAVHSGVRRDGPFWLAAVLSAGGILFFLLGSVKIVPWIEDERERQTVRSIWLALSRHLPDLGPDLVVKIGFWLIIAVVAVLSVALLFLASSIHDDAGAD